MDAALVKVGRMSRTAFIGMAAAAGVAIAAAVKSEKSLAMVSTMLDETTIRFLPAYKKGLRELSLQMGESGETLKRGLYDILSASIAPAKAMDVLAVAAKAAVGGMTDTSVSADALTTILNSYKMTAEDAAKVSDKLFMTVKRGKLTYAELAGSIGMVSATASIAGVSLDELLATVATVTRGGINAHVAMTAVTGVLKSFLKPTDDAKDMAKSLGIELSTATLKAEGLSGVFKKLVGMKAEDLAKLFPNIRGLRGVAIAMQDQAGLTKDLGLLMNSAGQAGEAFNKMSGTMAFQLGQLKQEISALAKDIGFALMPAFKDMVKGIKNFVGGLGAEGIATFIKWGLAITAVGIALPKLIGGLKLLSGALLFLMANPIAAIVLAIAAAFVGLGIAIANASKPVKKFKDTGKALKDNKAKIASAKSLMDELTSINDKEHLTNKERERAVELAKQLTVMYRSVGLSIDVVSGKVIGLVGAQERLAKIMEASLIRSTKADLEQQEARAGRIKTNLVDAKKYEGNWLRSPGLFDDGTEWVKKLEKGLKETREKIKELKKELDDLLQFGGTGEKSDSGIKDPIKLKLIIAQGDLDEALHKLSQARLVGDTNEIGRQQGSVNYLKETISKAFADIKESAASKDAEKKAAYAASLLPQRTKAEEAGYAKAMADNLSGAEQATLQNIALEYGQASATNFGLQLEGRKHKATHKAKVAAVEEAYLEGKISDKEAEDRMDSIAMWDKAVSTNLSERAKKQKGIFGEGGVKVDYDKGTWKGLAEVWRDMQSSIMKKDPQTEELKKQTEFLKVSAGLLRELVAKPTGATAQ